MFSFITKKCPLLDLSVKKSAAVPFLHIHRCQGLNKVQKIISAYSKTGMVTLNDLL